MVEPGRQGAAPESRPGSDPGHQGQGGCREGPRKKHEAARRASVSALCREQTRGADCFPGDGCGRQGRNHPSRHVGAESTGMQRHVLQGARPLKRQSTISSGASTRPRHAWESSPFSTARTMRMSWWCGCTTSCRNRSGPDGIDHINSFEKTAGGLPGERFSSFSFTSARTSRRNDSRTGWRIHPAMETLGGDFAERDYWDDYIEAYEDALTRCSTSWAPWYVIPANKKWYPQPGGFADPCGGSGGSPHEISCAQPGCYQGQAQVAQVDRRAQPPGRGIWDCGKRSGTHCDGCRRGD